MGVLRYESLCSRTYCPKYVADGPEVGDIPVFGTTGEVIEPTYRSRLQAWFGWISGGINDVDLNLDGISAATHPALRFSRRSDNLPIAT